jgi:hypothetical protein
VIYVIRERYRMTAKMDNIRDVKLSTLGDSNYVKPLRMHYTQACIVSTNIPNQECCVIFALMYKMRVKHDVGLLLRLCQSLLSVSNKLKRMSYVCVRLLHSE